MLVERLLILLYFDGVSYVEMVEIYGFSEGNVGVCFIWLK